MFELAVEAIKREKQLKNWRKEWKWNLVKEVNPDLKELWLDPEINSVYLSIDRDDGKGGANWKLVICNLSPPHVEY